MPLRALGASLFALVAAILLMPLAWADEEPASSRHALGKGPASIALPTTWRIERDPDGFWLFATDPKDPATLFAWSRTPLGEDGTLGRFYQHQLDAERGATIHEVGFRVDDVSFAPFLGIDAIWTLVQRPGARPPTRSLYVHFRHDGDGIALRVDLALGTYAARRAFVAGLLRTLDLGGNRSVHEGLARFRARTERDPPTTKEDYRAWLEELRLLGEEAEPELRAFVRRYVDGPGAEDEGARAFLGHRKFDHEIPEAIAFRGHSFLRVVEAACEKRWFTAGEKDAYDDALAAWEQTVAHGLRLAGDRAFRAANRTFANLAHDPQLSDLHLTFHWAEPYVLCHVADRARGDAAREELEVRGRALQTLYRYVLEEYGEVLGLKDLMAPWGGRPDYGRSRSFEDGVPLVVLVYDHLDTWRQVHAPDAWVWPRVPYLPNHYHQARERLALLSGRPAIEDATGGAYQLLYWFTRQQNRWQGSALLDPFLDQGLAHWLGATLTGSGKPGRHQVALDDMQRTHQALARREQAYPLFDVRAMLGHATLAEALSWMGRHAGVSANAGQLYFQQQAWAFIYFLHEADGGKYREKLLRLVQGVLGREAGRGMAPQLVGRVFGLKYEEDWEALQTEFDAYVRDHLLTLDLKAWAPAQR